MKPLDPNAIKRIQATFEAKIWPSKKAFGDAFYENLLQMAPSTAFLFPQDINHQPVKLMQFLRVGIESLDTFDAVAPLLWDLGARHVDYGVTGTHYDVGEEVLIKTMRDFFDGDDSTIINESAWRQAYRCLTSHMKEGARSKEDDWQRIFKERGIL